MHDLIKELSGWGFIINPSEKAVKEAFALQKKGVLRDVYLHDNKLYGKVNVEYTIYFEGRFKVKSKNYEEAVRKAYEKLMNELGKDFDFGDYCVIREAMR